MGQDSTKVRFKRRTFSTTDVLKLIKAPTQIAMEGKSSDQEEKLEILESMRDLWKRDNRTTTRHCHAHKLCCSRLFSKT